MRRQAFGTYEISFEQNDRQGLKNCVLVSFEKEGKPKRQDIKTCGQVVAQIVAGRIPLLQVGAEREFPLRSDINVKIGLSQGPDNSLSILKVVAIEM
jgi:hypothetical protein